MTNIEWTNETWNPIVGCTKVSEGCLNCYAEKMAFILLHMPYTDYYAYVLKDNGDEDPDKFKYLPKWNGETHFVESALYKPLKWKKPRMVFVCSMGDLFHESIPFEDIDKVFSITQKCPQHTFQVLTKRPEIMKEYFASRNITKPYTNVWLGVTAENQEQADKRIPVLLQIAAAVRFVSIEPMLSAVDIGQFTHTPEHKHQLNWVICGGESGHKARPMHPDWIRSLRDQCKQAEVPFFFKQWGEWMPVGQIGHTPLAKIKKVTEFNNGIFCKLGKKKSGRLLDGKEHNQFPIINKQL